MTGQRFTCIDCGALSPEVSADEGSTLVSIKHGWRIGRRMDHRGQPVIEARCPTCWGKLRSSATERREQ